MSELTEQEAKEFKAGMDTCNRYWRRLSDEQFEHFMQMISSYRKASIAAQELMEKHRSPLDGGSNSFTEWNGTFLTREEVGVRLPKDVAAAINVARCEVMRINAPGGWNHVSICGKPATRIFQVKPPAIYVGAGQYIATEDTSSLLRKRHNVCDACVHDLHPDYVEEVGTQGEEQK